jgi:hypothetical protein
MPRRPQRRLEIRDSVGLGGWLFADLMLALGLVFLVATSAGAPAASPAPASQTALTSSPMPGGTRPPATASMAPTASPLVAPSPRQSPASRSAEPSATASPSPSASCRPVLSLDKVTVEAGPGGEGEPPTQAQLQRAFRKYRDRVAGLIQAYGRTSRSNLSRGQEYARQALASLRRAVPEIFSPVTRTEAFLNQQADNFGQVTFSVYFLAAECE